MKYAATTLMGLLLLGVCSARITPSRIRDMDVTQNREADYSKLAQGDFQAGPSRAREMDVTQHRESDSWKLAQGDFQATPSRTREMDVTQHREADYSKFAHGDFQAAPSRTREMDVTQHRESDFWKLTNSNFQAAPSKTREMDITQHRESDFWKLTNSNFQAGPSKTHEMDVTQYREDSSKLAQDSRREGAQYKAEEQNTEKWSQLRETVSQKLRNMRQFSGDSYQLDNLPKFTDPIDIGSIVDQYALLNINYENVKFQGLGSAYQAVVDVDTDYEVATLTMSLKSVEISGNYAVTDQNRKVNGMFNIRSSGDMSFVCTYHYQRNGNNVQLLDSSGRMNYGSPVSHYDNAEFPDFIEHAVQTALLQRINEKVHAELHHRLNDRVLQYIQQVISSYQEGSVEKMMRNGIHNAVNGIQQILAKKGVSSIELTGDDKEMVYNKLHAKIGSVKLNGLQKFYLADNQISKENSDKVSAKLQLAIDRPTATAVVTIQESRDEDAPFQKINVDFDMHKLMAELMFEKATRQSGLNLRSFQTKVDCIRPTNTEKFQGEVRDLIKEKLTDHMKRYVEQALNKVIMNEYLFIMSRGMMPPSQEIRSAQKQM